ncbi:MAG: hypothetical protein IJU93_01875 [Lachnospiraceae bacterium]|nr:hypothetical protein [Lachnospiraceae bacterium]
MSDENTRKFLKVCTDVCFKVDRLCYGIYEANKFAEDSKAMDAAVEEFRKLKDSVKPEGMTEQELEIANAAEKSVTLHREVMDMLKSEYEEIV